MNYEKIIELSRVTLEDCLEMYEKKNMVSVINDGRMINFVKEKEM